ncbi:FG-GAP-like repeat-containing protein [Actinoplanes sp. NPDC049668]|uniref:FG-GAP-like repeat-containing protein n=1 Tax=unclassified Actinoplanes TaxID=2626549 RepID=UPI0033A6300D
MRIRSWFAFLAGTLLAVAGLGVARSAPAQAATSVPFRVLTFNVCGNNAPGDYNGSQGCMYRTQNLADSKAWVARLKTQILTEGGTTTPDIMMFQEMCAGQRDLIRAQLSGYQVAWVSFRKEGYACHHWDNTNQDKSFGTAIFYKGAAATPLTKVLRATNYPTVDKRALLCVPAPVGGRQALVCNVHNDASLADEGAHETVAQIQGWAAGRPVILGGDFNADPFDPQLNAYYGIGGGGGPFTEVDQGNRQYFTDSCRRLMACRTGEPTTAGGPPTSADPARKFDYLFASSASISWTARRVITPTNLTRVPDHRGLRGDGVWVDTATPSAPDVHQVRPLGWFGTADTDDWRGVRDMSVGRFAGRDQVEDVLVRRWTGEVQVYPGRVGGGRLGRPVTLVPANQGWSDGRKIVTGDFDGDDDDDIAILWSSGTIFVYPGDNDGHLSDWTMLKSNNFFSDARDIAAGDFNGDDRDDLLVEWSRGSLFFYPSLKTGIGLGDRISLMDVDSLYVASAEIYDEANLAKATPNGLLAGDVDHDANDDIVVRRTNGDLVRYTLTVNGSTFTLSAPATVHQQPEKLEDRTWPVNDVVGDLSGDGNDDIAVRWGNIDTAALHNAGLSDARRDDLLVYAAPRAGINPTSPSGVMQVDGFGAGLEDSADVIAGNLVGDDNRDDLLIRRESGTLSAYPGTSAGFASSSVQIGTGGAWKNARDIVAGDYNGDGHDDIVARWADGSVTMSPADGAGHLGSQVVMRSAAQGWSDAVEVVGGGDLTGPDENGNTYDDLVVRWTAGSVYLYPGNGAGGLGDRIVLRDAAQGWPDSVGMTVGRFTGDTLDDLVVRRRAGSGFVYPRLAAGGVGDSQPYRTAGTLTAAEGLGAGAFTQTGAGSRDVVALWDDHTVQLYPADPAPSDPISLRSTGGDIDHFEYAFDGATTWARATAVRGAASVSAPQGARQVQAVAVDRAGNRSAPAFCQLPA